MKLCVRSVRHQATIHCVVSAGINRGDAIFCGNRDRGRAIGDIEGIRENHHAAVAGHGSYRWLDLGHMMHLRSRDLDGQALAGILRGSHIERCPRRLKEDRDPGKPWGHVLQQAEPFASHGMFENHEPGDVGVRPR